MKFVKILFLIVLGAFFVGCAGRYKYNVEPTPIQKGVAKYIVSDFNLTLTNQPTRYEYNPNYKNESELRDEFVEFINKHLKEQGILGDENSFKIKIQMDYERWFNWGGKALNKPHFSYSVKIYDNADRLLVSYAIPVSIAVCGKIMLMPGLPKVPAAVNMRIDAEGKIDGLS